MKDRCARYFINGVSSSLAYLKKSGNCGCGFSNSSLFYVNCRAPALRVSCLLPRLQRVCPAICGSSVRAFCCKRKMCDRVLPVAICKRVARITSTRKALLLPSNSDLGGMLQVQDATRVKRRVSTFASVCTGNSASHCSVSSLLCQLRGGGIA